MSIDRLLLAVLASFAWHYGIFLFSSSSHHKPAEHRSRIASSGHALGSSLLVVYWLLKRGGVDVWDGPLMIAGQGLEASEYLFMRLTIAFSIGYFMSDLLVMLTHPKTVLTLDSVIHHMLIMPFFGLALYYKVTTPYQFLFLLEEVSTPFGNWRWSLLPKKGQSLNKNQAARLDLASKLFALSFFAARGIAGSILWSTYWSNHSAVSASLGWDGEWQETVSYVQFTAASLTRVLNFHWMFLIYKAATRHLKQSPTGGKPEGKKQS